MIRAVITVCDGKIFLRTEYKHKDLCKSIPGRAWDKNIGAWVYPATPAAAAGIAEYFMPNYPCPEFDALLNDNSQRIAAYAKIADDLPVIPNTKTAPWKHQIQTFWFAHNLPAAMLALDMGTGKTKVGIDLIVNKEFKKVLIVCPKAVIQGWKTAFAEHSCINSQNILTLEDKDPVRLKSKWVESQLENNELSIIVVNYESAWREPLGKVLMTAGLDCVILDESHRIKAPGGKASKFFSRLSDVVGNKYCLTGTPMPHSPLDVYGQFRFLDKGIFGTSFEAFRSKYAIMGGFENRQVMAFKNQHELNQRFYSIAIRFESADVLDLPESTHQARVFELDSATRKIYAELENHFIAEVRDGIVTANNALTKLLRLQQITGGFVKTEDDKIQRISTEKAATLADTLTDLESQPVVIFARFHEDLDIILATCRQAGRNPGELSGRVNNLHEWESGLIDTIVVQINTGSEGVDTLKKSCVAIYYSVGFSLGNFNQSLARLNRPGQTKSVRYIHLIANKTVDQKIYKSLKDKADIVESILTEIKGERK